MNLAPPIPRLGLPRRRGRAIGGRGATRPPTGRPVKAKPASVLQRERHQADYVILVVVVALAAIGILMVYSSSAIRGYLRERRHVRDRRPADPVGGARDRRDGRS